MEKALREAKIHTSWMNPSEEYEAAVRDFVSRFARRQGSGVSRPTLTQFVARIADAGFVNSLAQLVLKMTLPGVPDFYQGTELWDFNLVDPDNRRPVDFDVPPQRLEQTADAAREATLQAFAANLRAALAGSRHQAVDHVALPALPRRECADVFAFGEYMPLTVDRRSGRPCDRASHVVSKTSGQSSSCRGISIDLLERSSGNDDSNAARRKPTGATRRSCCPTTFPRAWRCELSGRDCRIERRKRRRRTFDVAELFRRVSRRRC